MQPPPGYQQGPQNSGSQNYNQGPQQYNARPQGYGPPPGQPQYGMQQYPYSPPQKKGMPAWAIVLIVVGILIFVVPFVIGLGAALIMPSVVSNTRDAQRAEGEQVMGSARDFLRVEYSRTGTESPAFQLFTQTASTGTFDGLYYKVDREARTVNSPRFDAQVSCSPVPGEAEGHGQMQFQWETGNSETTWKD